MGASEFILSIIPALLFIHAEKYLCHYNLVEKYPQGAAWCSKINLKIYFPSTGY
jgi:hypothetical protein